MKRLVALSILLLLFPALLHEQAIVIKHKVAGGCSHGTYVVTATGSGSWTVPAGCTSVNIALWGAGGGAGGNAQYAGSGTGAYVYTSNLSVTPGSSITYVIGAGGQGVTSQPLAREEAVISRGVTEQAVEMVTLVPVEVGVVPQA
jgi:hypothetical protein